MWSKRPVHWTDHNDAYLSVVFTWHLPQARETALELAAQGYTVHAGGPAVALMPEQLADIATVNEPNIDALPHHNPDATFTTRGCIRTCPFCAVPKIEGDLVELEHWTPRPIVCDNNLLACSRRHFDRVVDRLKPLTDIDFNQGLDARLLSTYHANRLAELNCRARLAFDNIAYEGAFMRAYERLRRAGFPKHRIRVYVLIGYDDTPEDALYRLQTVHNLGSKPNPMRYQPLDTLQRNTTPTPPWTHAELTRYMRYWSNLRYVGAVPFQDFHPGGHHGL